MHGSGTQFITADGVKVHIGKPIDMEYFYQKPKYQSFSYPVQPENHTTYSFGDGGTAGINGGIGNETGV